MIERGGDGTSKLELTPPKVSVLTARAEEFKAALEIKDESKLAQAFRKTGELSKTNPTKDWGGIYQLIITVRFIFDVDDSNISL